MRSLTVFLLLAVPAAFAHSQTFTDTNTKTLTASLEDPFTTTEILTAPLKDPFTTFTIPAGGTYTISMIRKFWDLSGSTTATDFSFSFNVDHTLTFGDFFGGFVTISINGTSYGGSVIQAHLNGSEQSGVLYGGWTGPGSEHGRFAIALNGNGQLGAGTFSLANTPEPGTLSLMGTGCIAIFACLRRRINRGTRPARFEGSRA